MKYFVANWKLNMDLKDITMWYQDFEKELQVKETGYKIIIAASFIHLPILKEFPDPMINLASQDVSIHSKGAHTGETGAFQVKEFCKYALIGHSERKEPREVVLAKRDKCLENKITPIICFVNIQDAGSYLTDDIMLAWEDPSNISIDGKYRDKNPKDIEQGIQEIRKIIPNKIPLLYGGSVNRSNIVSISANVGLDGVLIGNASLDPKHFSDIIRNYPL